ncbi:MAG: cation transporter [Alphaproteobacteria bacterium]|nr:MAG: cation transporter [Alphaproteobacteria bacterium]
MLVLALNLAITLAEIVGGLISGSLALISDGLHNASDGVAIVIAWIAMKLQAAPRTDRHTFGLGRAQLIAAVINAGTLVAVSIWLFFEAGQRLLSPEPVSGGVMIAVAAIGLVANTLGTFLLREGSENNLNLRAAYLHLLSDAVSSLAVIVGAVAIVLWNVTWVDPVLTFAIGAWVLWESLRILWRAVDQILLAAPEGLALADVRAAILGTEGVVAVHHTHLWQATEGDIHFEAHIVVPDQMLTDIDVLRARIAEALHEKFEITHPTLQFEAESTDCTTANLT